MAAHPRPEVCRLAARLLQDAAAAEAVVAALRCSPEAHAGPLAPLLAAELAAEHKAQVGLFLRGEDPSEDEHDGPPLPGPPPRAAEAAAAREEPPRPRSQTLVIAYFPRKARDNELRFAIDAALGGAGAVRRFTVIRDDHANGKYAFVEFKDMESADRAYAACGRGLVVMMDEDGRAWRLRASRSERAIVGQAALGRAGVHRARRGRRAP